jgi:tetratricopeptide (TPR) repeat protein
MDSLQNLRTNIELMDRQTLLAVVAVVVLVVANILFIRSLILPQWSDKRELTSLLDSARKDLEKARKAQSTSAEDLQKKMDAQQSTLGELADRFLTDAQATDILNSLYQYASESQVEIVSLQTQPSPPEGEEQKESYAVEEYRLEAKGTLPNLVDFVSRIKEAAFESFVMTNVNIAEGEEQHTLSMDIALYSSPLSSGAVVQPTPGITVTPESVAQLEEMLAAAWDLEDWEQVITLIEQILALEPDYAGMTEKLYAAHVNYGYQLLNEGNPDGATAQFNSALEIRPDGVEAQVGREQAVAWVPTPTTAPPTTAPPTTAPALTAEEQLAQSLHEPWAAKDWARVISLIEQILAINPNYDDMTEKLYAAHVNYGQQFAAQGKLEEAKLEFTRALQVKPDGGEAMAGLQALAAGETPAPSATATPVPQPQYIIHVVQPGEWLYQIARMYGTTAQAIMVANGLTSSTIHPGQQLRIPIE